MGGRVAQKCATPYCGRAAYKRPDGYRDNLCCRCNARRWKTSSPFAYHFNALRGNARRRGKEFTLTIDQYKEFAIREGLFSPAGVKYPNRSIDRIDQSRGYHIDNIQVLTISENVRKKYTDYWSSKYNEMSAEEAAYYQQRQQELLAEIEARRQHEQEFDELPF